MQYIYLISCGENYKIGVANDVMARLASLQTGNPFELRVQSCYGFDNADIIERVLHQKFSDLRMRGEWFALRGADLDEFENICTILGGQPLVSSETATDEDAEQAEDMQEALLSNALGGSQRDSRFEKRYLNGKLIGFVFRERGKERKFIRYVGYEANKEEFDKIVEKEGLQNE